MSYQVRYTDSTNLDKPALTVEDSTINSATSLQFPGRNVTGYGTIIAENFLHLLENFANDSAPDNPVEGQLWYDNTSGVNQLKVYDGTSWSSAGGLKKGNVEPELATSLPGDLWVNTDTQQLYLYTGSGWILVGPRFSEGARTGAEPEFIEDTLSNAQPVVSNYINGERVCIISQTAFTPKTVITGFQSIKAGVNLHSDYNTYWGVAEKAAALLVGTTTVSASNFLRGDATSNTNFPLNVRSSSGLSVGEDNQLNLGIDGAAGVLFHKTSGSNLDIRMNNNGSIRTVIRVDSSERVGINNTNPQTDLDVGGDINASGNITADGNAEFGGTVNITGGLSINGDVSFGTDNTNTVTVSGAILPDVNLGADIGTVDKKFQRIWSSRFDGTFYGDLIGSVTGNASGSSSKLASPTIFDLDGDITSNEVEFDGQTGTPTLNTLTANGTGVEATLTFVAQTVAPYPTGSTIIVSGIAPTGYRGTYTVTDGGLDYVKYASNQTGPQTTAGAISRFGLSGNRKRFYTQLSESFIADKPEVLAVQEDDKFLVQRGAEGLKQITKASLWSAIPITPTGVVLPFAGLTAPTGWLFCDGSEVLISDYPELFEILGYQFGDITTLLGLGTFKLPDMRGRFPLAMDSMNNGITVPSAADPTVQISTSGGAANRVTDAVADIVGQGGGVEKKLIDSAEIPDHVHDMTGDDGNKYYAFRNVPGDPTDTNALSGEGSTVTARGQYMTDSGRILDYPRTPGGDSIQSQFNVMNPFLTLNYIINTGRNVL
jgi:microcystin-dependent protein